MMNRRSVLTGLVSAPFVTRAFAQGSTRETKFVVPFNAGGANDVMMRQLQPILKEQGLSIIIENIVGANGSIGMRNIAQAEPDGFTIGMGTSSTLAFIAQGKTPLKNDQFAHLVRASVDPLILLVPGKSPIQTIDQFVDHLKKNPGKVSVGTPGTFTPNHMLASLVARAADVPYLMVPYTGGSKVVQDLTGGQVESAILKPNETLGQILEKLVRPIGVFANERLSLLPDVPTFKERGIDVFPYGPVTQMSWIAAPAKLPAELREKVTKAFRTAIADKRFTAFAEKNGFVVDDLTGDAMAREVDTVTNAMRAVFKQVFKET